MPSTLPPSRAQLQLALFPPSPAELNLKCCSPIRILSVNFFILFLLCFLEACFPFIGVSILRYALIGRSLASIILPVAGSPLVFKSCILFCLVAPPKPVICFVLINLFTPLHFKPIHRTMLIHAMITNNHPEQRMVKSRRNSKYIPAVRETIPYKAKPYQQKTENVKY